MGTRARLITTSLTAAVTVGSVAAMADAESSSTDPTGEVAGALVAAFGDAWVAEGALAAPDPVSTEDEPVRVPARIRVRVSG